MPYIRLGKEREALHGRSEQYKRSALAYFQSRGYVLDVDSLIEGTFEDQIYLTKVGLRISVELKDTELSITESSFLVPYGINLANFANSATDNRFSFVFCARSFKNDDFIELVFGKVRDNDAALKFFGKVAVALTKDGRSESLRAAEILKTIDEKTIYSFIENTEIIDGDYTDLERAADEWTHSRGSAFLSSLSSKDEVIKSFERTSKPDDNIETLASNLMQVVSRPEILFYAKTRYKSRMNILKRFNYETPPFILREKTIYTFSDLKDTENPLFGTIQKGSKVFSDFVGNIFNTQSKQFWLTDLLNRCVNESLFSRGLRKRGKRFIFVSYEGEDVRVKWNPGTGSVQRTFTRCKIRDDGTIVYCVHKALRTSFKKLGDNYYLILEPCFHFTVDGSKSMTPRKNTEFSSKAWAYHGNSKLLYDVRFWINFLSRGRETIEIQTGGQPVIINTLYETTQTTFGISEDTHVNKFLLSPIQFPMTNPFRAVKLIQTEIEDFFDLHGIDIMESSELEGLDDEWD
ncbi:MAG: hypothetical protein ACTSWA_10825 [Candidatus Thorarchaeota archaeon]